MASLLFVLPLAWGVFRSLLPSTMVSSAPSRSDLSHLTFGNYSGLIRDGDILHYTLNSLLVAVITAIATVVAATMAGYGFARFRFRGSGLVFALVLATLMVPFQALLTPLFLEMNSLGLTNSLVGLAVFYTNNLYTLPLTLLNMEYSSVGQVNFGYLEAGAVIAMIRCVVLYIALQRYHIRGLTSGVVKG